MFMTYEELEQIRKKYNEKRAKIRKVFLVPYLLVVFFFLSISLFPEIIAAIAEREAIFAIIRVAFFQIISTLVSTSIFFFVIYLIVSTIKTSDEATDYRNAYKNYFITATFKKVFTDLQYNHAAGMPRVIPGSTGMMRLGDHYSSNDYTIAKYKGIGFSQADVHIQEEHTDSDGDTTYVTIFRGRYVVFDMHKKFEKKLMVVGKNFHAYKKDGSFRKIELESINFNRRFKVYAQDGFEAFYLLDPAVMERIEKLADLHNDRIMICFFENKIHIAINNNIDSFEPASPKLPIDEKTEFDKVINDIKVITNIIDEVKLVK